MWNRKSKINNFKLFLACSTTKEIRINSNLWKNTKKQSGIKNDREPGAVIKDIGNRKIESAEETDIKMKVLNVIVTDVKIYHFFDVPQKFINFLNILLKFIHFLNFIMKFIHFVNVVTKFIHFLKLIKTWSI